MRRAAVVMGVSGSGKSTLARSLATELGADFIEGDALHPPANIARMAKGVPLTDADRSDWLRSLGAELQRAREQGRSVVLACSALKRSYRDLLRAAEPELLFLHLHGSPELLESRMRARSGHYMPVSLLQSQLDTLEPPGADERALRLDAAQALPALTAAALRGLDLETARAP